MDCTQLENERKCLELELDRPFDDEPYAISGEQLNMLNPYPLYTIGSEREGETCKRLYREKDTFRKLDAYSDTTHVYRISVPSDATVYIHYHQFETETYKIEETYDIKEFINMAPLQAVQYCVWALKYVNPQTDEICKKAVTYKPLSLEYVEHQTKEICWIALNHIYSGYLALKFVKEQTYDMCMAVVLKNGLALRFVKEQTHDMCMAVVSKEWYALPYVVDKTPDICSAAIKNNGLARYCI